MLFLRMQKVWFLYTRHFFQEHFLKNQKFVINIEKNIPDFEGLIIEIHI